MSDPTLKVPKPPFTGAGAPELTALGAFQIKDEVLGREIPWRCPSVVDYRSAADPRELVSMYLRRLVASADGAAILTTAQVPHIVDDMLWLLRWSAGYFVAQYQLCPDNCGCRLDGEDADRRECACGGPCCDGEIRYLNTTDTSEPIPGL